MARIFKNKWFARFARKELISDETLCQAVHRLQQGLMDANLGGGVIKQRLPRQGSGSSGGYRSIILFRYEDRAFFVYGFAKSERDNIDEDELTAFRKLADAMLPLDWSAIDRLLKSKALVEVICNGSPEVL